MKVDLEKYREYIETRIAEGASLRMLENEIGIERQKLSREMKKAGMRVPTRIESVKFLWKNHKHPHIGKTGSLCPTYGRKMSDETKQKLREAMAGDKNLSLVRRKKETLKRVYSCISTRQPLSR